MNTDKIKIRIKKSIVTQNLFNDGNKKILLTFDDGPMTDVTTYVLDRLSKYKVKSLFFVVGKRIVNRHDILRAIIKAGHEIGNHTFSHNNNGELPFREYFNDVVKCQKLIKSITGEFPRFFRPPGGTISIKSLLIPKLLGLKTINWSIDVADWKCKNMTDVDTASKLIINSVTNNDIVLLHDDNKYILPLLDFILPHLSKYNMDINMNKL